LQVKNKRKTSRASKESAQKYSNIAEIIALLEERKKSKEWIFQQVKKHRLKINYKRTMNSFQVLKSCPDEFVSHTLEVLRGNDLDDFHDIISLSKTYHWFFTDVVAGANPSMETTEQLRKIATLHKLVANSDTFSQRDHDTTIVMPTGDGMVIGFDDSSEKPLLLAIELHKAITRYNKSRRGNEKILIRIGLDTGPIYTFKDLEENESVWGPGIIMANRVMNLGGDMQIFTSGRIAEDIRTLSPKYKEIFHHVGEYAIKHGEQLQIYNVYGEGFGNKYSPRKGKVLKDKKESSELLKGINTFAFSEIDVELLVTNTTTFLTHHTIKWHVTNISKEIKNQIFYYLDGDTPKDLSDMNIKVTDEAGNNLEIADVSVNKPYHKEFNIQLKNPLKPRQKHTTLTLEYDWEEPERSFFYKLASDCKKFKYRFLIPKGTDITNKAMKVDTEMGYKWYTDPPPKLRYHKDYTEVIWEGKNLRAYDAFKFEW
jgi:class 3 adenylate cyclase